MDPEGVKSETSVASVFKTWSVCAAAFNPSALMSSSGIPSESDSIASYRDVWSREIFPAIKDDLAELLRTFLIA